MSNTIGWREVMELATEYGKRLCDVFASLTVANTKAAADAETALQEGIQSYAEGYAAAADAERAALERRIELAESLLVKIAERTELVKQSGLGGLGAEVYDLVMSYPPFVLALAIAGVTPKETGR